MKSIKIAALVLAATLSASVARADVFLASALGVGVNEVGNGYAQGTGNIVASFTEKGVTYSPFGPTNLAQVKTAPSDGDGAVPLAVTGNYISVLGGGTLQLTFAETSSLGFYWGSIDGYNSIEFFNNGVSVGSLTGTNAALQASLLANGDQGSYNSNRYVVINDTNGVFDEARFSSDQNSFEFQNVSAIPEAS